MTATNNIFLDSESLRMQDEMFEYRANKSQGRML